MEVVEEATKTKPEEIATSCSQRNFWGDSLTYGTAKLKLGFLDYNVTSKNYREMYRKFSNIFIEFK